MELPVDIFQIEAREHLDVLQFALLELESDPANNEYIDQAFRSMHTIKGAGGMFGFNDLTNFTHHLETTLEKARNQVVVISSDLISVLLDSGDFIGTTLDSLTFTAIHVKQAEELLLRLRKVIGVDKSSFTTNVIERNQEDNIIKSDQVQLFHITFTPDASTFQNGLDIVPILRELNSLGCIDIVTQTETIAAWSLFDPERCYLSFDLVLATSSALNEIEDVFLFVIDDWQVAINTIDEESKTVDATRISAVLTQCDQTNSANSITAVTAITEQAIPEQAITETSIAETNITKTIIPETITRAKNSAVKPPSKEDESTVRVPTSRLDALMNIVGELVIVQARLNQIAHIHESEDIVSISEELELLTTQMRDQTFNIRMLTIGTTFGRFRRLVRDLSKELAKEIVLLTEGAETELDKMVLDKLADPLVHLIRNSIDHGIESPANRVAQGKSSQGTILLSAKHADSQVVITIKDDGAGLDCEKIQQKAISKGLLSADDNPTLEQIQQLIFEPGFSLAKQVSDISGRGVGMDVVKRSITELGGKVAIESQPGKGTTFTIHLPMTLAIIEGLMVAVADEHYVLPLSCVEECIEITQNERTIADRQRLVNVRGEQIPYLSLREWFHLSGERRAIEQIVITRFGDERFGFCVDEVIGQYQTVIKRLGKLYEGMIGFTGATILGDGSVAIVLDPQALMEAI